jgi:hypothetical protein
VVLKNKNYGDNMSYIPKYILKRMIPQDAVKIDGDNIIVEMTNVISPISIDEAPDNVLDYFELKIDGNIHIDGTKPDEGKHLKVEWEGKIFTIDNFKEAVGLTLPVGGKLKFIFRNPNLKSGGTHKFNVTIRTNNPVNIEFERTIQ